jgi:hypothetical protein
MKILSTEGSADEPARVAAISVGGVAVGILEVLSVKFGENNWAVLEWDWNTIPGQPFDNILKLKVRVRGKGETDFHISFGTPIEWNKSEAAERRIYVTRMMDFLMKQKGAKDLREPVGLSLGSLAIFGLISLFAVLLLLRACR